MFLSAEVKPKGVFFCCHIASALDRSEIPLLKGNIQFQSVSIHHCPQDFSLLYCRLGLIPDVSCLLSDQLVQECDKETGSTVNFQSNELFFIKNRLNHKQNQIKHKEKTMFGALKTPRREGVVWIHHLIRSHSR